MLLLLPQQLLLVLQLQHQQLQLLRLLSVLLLTPPPLQLNFMEVSVVVFLAMGYQMSGGQALRRTVAVAGAGVCWDSWAAVVE